MSIILPDVRFHTSTSPYHYTEDNKPLEDLEARDNALKTAIEEVTTTNQSSTKVGHWSGLQVTFDLADELNQPFAYRIRVWALEDQSLLASQSSTILEDVVIGYNQTPNVVVLNYWNIFSKKVGTPTLTTSYSGSGNNLVLSFSGYSGTGAFVRAKAEKFGI